MVMVTLMVMVMDGDGDGDAVCECAVYVLLANTRFRLVLRSTQWQRRRTTMLGLSIWAHGWVCFEVPPSKTVIFLFFFLTAHPHSRWAVWRT